MNPTIELLKSHRSVRKFTEQKIPHETLLELIRAGQSAATSSHVQAYSVIHVTNPANREQIAELAGGQPYIARCSDFLVFCADMKRPTEAAERTGAEVTRGMTEQFLVASVDTALMAQNVVVAAESEGLGICYIGGIRNNPQAISEMLELPDHVFPVFGLCLGYPDPEKLPEVKPRLPVEAVFKEDTYTEDAPHVATFDSNMKLYYQARSNANKDTDWSHNLTPLFSTKVRPHMRDFLLKRGFDMK
ncbi:oxygen-insensitive NADPH nitroreductase [Halomonas sp. 18H]|uniref:oxygen-insensitive NADPH nitroreductase n=1 Tax=Halomonas almeriensis TaxID=308163 RepID=UPI00222F3301|nr:MULTISPECIES: oxygen-insensitive NADPH nitroreductase [Halomonas]MCW4152785.1 oxygen-insensitive NADPH nitroreductase [Halomonas sp. 18H]MDN3552016.1 oxygen-insensitive NADPH nitroreductase [Halomonas almeriensis]